MCCDLLTHRAACGHATLVCRLGGRAGLCWLSTVWGYCHIISVSFDDKLNSSTLHARKLRLRVVQLCVSVMHTHLHSGIITLFILEFQRTFWLCWDHKWRGRKTNIGFICERGLWNPENYHAPSFSASNQEVVWLLKAGRLHVTANQTLFVQMFVLPVMLDNVNTAFKTPSVSVQHTNDWAAVWCVFFVLRICF